MKILSTLLLLFFTTSTFGFVFKKGDGSSFKMNTNGQSVELNIYVSSVATHNMNIEFHFGSGGLLASNMWQQFEFELKDRNPISIKAGYIKLAPNRDTEIMTEEMFKLNKGVQVENFLFNSEAQISQDYVGDEKVETPAGTIVAKHYKKTVKDQTVHYWIADRVKPIGLVKLVSKSEKIKSNNYTIELKNLLTSVKSKIDPSKAKAISKETRETFLKK